MEGGLAALFLAAFLTGLSGAASPGPMLTWNVAAAARHGALVGPVLVLGHAAVELPLVLALGLGLAAFVREPTVLAGLGLLGAAVLLWMAAGTLRAVPALPDPAALRTAEAGGRRLRGAFAAGALLSLGNPYWALWWATVGAGLLGQAVAFGALGLAVFFVGHILSDFGWYSLVSVAMARGVRLLSRRLYQGVMAALGVAMIVLAVLFGVSAVMSIAGR
ncbi:MAG: LysE family transporter [Chloroflexota bacterium]|nr:LysE family translocator [Dehalococcoidia bacterium]MDW8253836.1 LysE family transporter [Chloroflexota bacterium]